MGTVGRGFFGGGSRNGLPHYAGAASRVQQFPRHGLPERLHRTLFDRNERPRVERSAPSMSERPTAAWRAEGGEHGYDSTTVAGITRFAHRPPSHRRPALGDRARRRRARARRCRRARRKAFCIARGRPAVSRRTFLGHEAITSQGLSFLNEGALDEINDEHAVPRRDARSSSTAITSTTAGCRSPPRQINDQYNAPKDVRRRAAASSPSSIRPTRARSTPPTSSARRCTSCRTSTRTRTGSRSAAPTSTSPAPATGRSIRSGARSALASSPSARTYRPAGQRWRTT